MGVEYYRPGDTGTVARIYKNNDGVDIVETLWERTRNSIGEPMDIYMTRIKIIGASQASTFDEFTITFENPNGAKYGITKVGNMITEVRAVGLIAEWNTAHPTDQIEVGDTIVAVNGKNLDDMSTSGQKLSI